MDLSCSYDQPTHAVTVWDGRFRYWYWMNAWTHHNILACLEGRIRWTIDLSSSYGQPTRPEATAWDDILPKRNEWTNQIHASNSCSWSVAGHWSYLTFAVRIDLTVATKYLTSISATPLLMDVRAGSTSQLTTKGNCIVRADESSQ